LNSLRHRSVALGNWGSEEAVAVLTSALSVDEPLIRAHAAWSLGRIGSAQARSALTERLLHEMDAGVIDEIRAALQEAGSGS
jgi:epoxyqueuosine reductase